jgi:hypothetical protein
VTQSSWKATTVQTLPLSKIVQSRVARIAVGPSTVRGKGNKGIVAAARRYVGRLDLSGFGTADGAEFRKVLDDQTEALRCTFPEPARHWGIARKVLNIFLRDSFYSTYLCDEFGLGQGEFLFEIPLDRLVSDELHKAVRSGTLPKWPGVRGVTPELNDTYQAAASNVASSRRLARVHLDALWWSTTRD